MKRLFNFWIILFVVASACKQTSDSAALNEFYKKQLSEYNRKLTQIIIGDVFSPPVCSRIYAYSNIAAYEALRQSNKKYPSYAGRLHDLKKTPAPDSGRTYDFSISEMIAFFTAAQKLVFNAGAVSQLEKEYLSRLKAMHVDEELVGRSIEYGRKVGLHILDWASGDGYLQRTALSAYMVNKDPSRWQPTPPDYMDAIEPNWKTLRTFLLDSASQFRPEPPPKFDTTSGSIFYQAAIEVYNSTLHANPEQIAIAKFWDCNPNISTTQGHVTYFQQKISPGGHWIHVAASVAEKEKFDQLRTAEIISQTAIALADAFISCWEAKYLYIVVRPETYINKYIDRNWRPVLQTPGFPEYTSGHSVVSSCAAVMLTKLLGDHYHYTDSTEVPFGIPARQFNSFLDASAEASISRLYGGIHYLPAIKNGVDCGKRIGDFVFLKLN
ncbi:MAG: vanadium-dependent haloperoxidase [Bacteroidetes bacterium]|nr:vanadium-dependent haloperoxidase [Bacteroidota bacterium]